MRVHVEGAISDLHAADGRYHVDCMLKFMNKRSVTYADACSSCTTQDELDNAFCEVTAVVSEDLSRIWNSVKLCQLYQSKGGQMLTKRQVVDQLVITLEITCLVIIIIFISYYNGTRFTKEIQLYIYLQKIFIIA